MKNKDDKEDKTGTQGSVRMYFRKAVCGDSDAYWQLIEPFSGLIYSVALGILKDPELAQDILHEVYVKAFHSLGNLLSPQSISSWLHSITRNLCYERLRKRGRLDKKKKQIFNHKPRVVPIQEILIKEEELQLLQKALDSLPEPFRVILGMKYMNRLKCKEIAGILDISEQAVKSRLFEARKLLARRMTKHKKSMRSEQNGGLRK